MICCFPVHDGDVALLSNLLLWINQLGGANEHKAFIVADAATKAQDIFSIVSKAESAFSSVSVVCTPSHVSGWIPGANALFLEAAKIGQSANEPWLFMEPDAVPVRTGWLDMIQIAYMTSGTRYMGPIVPCSIPGLPMLHMPGVSVYPPTAYIELKDRVLSNPNKAFDISIADLTVPSCKKSDLFQHLWGEVDKPPTFGMTRKHGTNVFSIDYIKKSTALFHRNKDGTLIDLLRAAIGIKKKTFIQLGKTGDIICALPAMKWLYDNDGIKHRFVTAAEMVNVLQGVSYVDPVALDVHWWMDLKKAYEYCKSNFGDTVVLQCHGGHWPVDTTQPSFMLAVHSRTGIPMELFHSLQLVFDRRDPDREKKFIPQTNGVPYILVNTTGFSSPFQYLKQLNAVIDQFAQRVRIINMDTIRVPLIYDLLGAYDNALGTIHVDTATMHLAHGSPTPYIAFSRGGWASSIPRGNCVLNMNYDEYPARSKEVVRVIESWLKK